MVIDFVLLAYGAPSNEGIDEGGQSRPPEVVFQERFGTKPSHMSRGGRVMYGADDGLLFMWGNVHMALEVQVAVGHVPIVHGGAGEQGGPLFQVF